MRLTYIDELFKIFKERQLNKTFYKAFNDNFGGSTEKGKKNSEKIDSNALRQKN